MNNTICVQIEYRRNTLRIYRPERDGEIIWEKLSVKGNSGGSMK